MYGRPRLFSPCSCVCLWAISREAELSSLEHIFMFFFVIATILSIFRAVAEMSLASSPDLFRPEDKAFKTLFLSGDDSTNAFDEYLNGEIYDHSDQESDRELSDVLTGFLERKQSIGSRTGYTPIIAPSTRPEEVSPQPWRKGLWCMNQTTTATPGITVSKRRINAQQRRTSQKRSHGGDEKEAYLDPRSLPSTPSLQGTKSFATSPRTANVSGSPYARQRPLSREVTLSPSPSYARLQSKSRMLQQESLQRGLQNFHLRRSEVEILSPPSGNIPRQRLDATQLNAAIATQNNTAVMQHGYQTMYPIHHQTQMEGEGLASVDPSLLSPSQIGQAISSHGDEAVYDSRYQVHSSHGHPIWTTESLESSDESQYSYDSLRSLENAQLVQEGHSWTSPGLSTDYVPVPQQCSQQYYYPILAQPTPHRTTHRLIQQPPSIHADGLGIHFPPSSHLVSQTQNNPVTNPMQGYPPLPPSTYAFTNEDPFSTPRRTRRQSSPLRSPSPCISPTNTSRMLRQRSPTHHASPTRNRRKSIGNAGPITHTAAPPVPRTPKTPKTPRTPTGHGVIDFVNFTPKDRAKLLSDVAPSGSSRTRARREAEAKEKRRRLNEAAMKAVERAGGDLRALKAEGLCLS